MKTNESVKKLLEKSKKEIDECNIRIDDYQRQIDEYERDIDDLKYKPYKGSRDSGHKYADSNERYNDRRFQSYSGSGMDLSSDGEDPKPPAEINNDDYVKVKIEGLETEIQKLKQMQVQEQKNINEIQSKINNIQREHNIRQVTKVKQELNRQEKYMTPTKG
ncbi:unnamed protein product [Moneuplotes crassus]|uniref:Uncharacterized protein n=2 Tax=Euplotes crassus TaxID=5936 RepID=A0AAD1XSG4_EUPCR|nr:unnamed protein product [Moneuplotes crassus]